MQWGVGFNFFSPIALFGLAAAAPVDFTTSSGYPSGFGIVAGGYQFGAPSQYGTWGSIGDRYARRGPGHGAFAIGRADPVVYRGAVRLSGMFDGGLEQTTMALRHHNDVNGFHYTSDEKGRESPEPPPSLKDRAARYFDGMVIGERNEETGQVRRKDPTKVYDTDTRKAIREAEIGSETEGENALLVEFVKGSHEIVKSPSARERFMAADKKLFDGNPSAAEIFRRKLLNLTGQGANGEPDDGVNRLIMKLLGDKAPRGKDKYAYLTALEDRLEEFNGPALREAIEDLYDYTKRAVTDVGYTTDASPSAQVIAGTLTGWGYDAAMATAAAAELAHLEPTEWEDAEDRIRTAAEAAKKEPGLEVQSQRRFEAVATEILLALGITDDGKGGTRDTVYDLAVARKGTGAKKEPDYRDLVKFVARARKIIADLKGMGGTPAMTLTAVRKKYENGKG